MHQQKHETDEIKQRQDSRAKSPVKFRRMHINCDCTSSKSKQEITGAQWSWIKINNVRFFFLLRKKTTQT